MAPALKRGTVAAAPIAEPTLSAVLKDGGIRVLLPPFLNVYGLHFMVGGWFTTTDWIAKNRHTSQRFIDAIYATGKWANEHPAESALILAKYAKLDPTIVLGMNRAPYGSSLSPEMIQSVLDLSYKYGVFDHRVMATDLIASV